MISYKNNLIEWAFLLILLEIYLFSITILEVAHVFSTELVSPSRSTIHSFLTSQSNDYLSEDCKHIRVWHGRVKDVTPAGLSKGGFITTLFEKDALLLSTAKEICSEYNVNSYRAIGAYSPLCSHEEGLQGSLLLHGKASTKDVIAQCIISLLKARANNDKPFRSMQAIVPFLNKRNELLST